MHSLVDVLCDIGLHLPVQEQTIIAVRVVVQLLAVLATLWITFMSTIHATCLDTKLRATLSENKVSQI